MLESLRIGVLPKINPLSVRNIREFTPDTKPNLRQELRKDTFVKPPSFKGVPKWSTDFEIKRQKGLPCACCGKKTLTSSQFYYFSENIASKTGEALAKELTKHYKYYDPTEKLVVDELIKYSKNNPEAGIAQLVKIANQGTRAKLEDEQIQILDKINAIGEQLSNGDRAYLQRFINNSANTVRSREEEFKRKTFISNLQDMAKGSSYPEVYARIVQEAEKLPTSRLDIGAFLIKYSKDKRSEIEIAQRLLKPCLATTEHIIPRSTNEWGKKESELYKEDNTENFIIFCDDCNQRRKKRPYTEWIEMNPSMPHNLQNYLYAVGKRIRSGELRDYNDYPQDIVNTIEKVTNGLVKLQLPRTN